MQQQQFSEMEMPTQSSPNHHQSTSHNYQHPNPQHQSTSSATGASTSKRMSSQATNMSAANSMNPNGMNAIASSSHCVSSSSSSPPPSSAGRHGYSNLPNPGSPAGAPGLAESSFSSPLCYNNNNNNPGDIIAPGASPHSVIHCSHLSSGHQHPVQNYLQGKEIRYHRG